MKPYDDSFENELMRTTLVEMGSGVLNGDASRHGIERKDDRKLGMFNSR